MNKTKLTDIPCIRRREIDTYAGSDGIRDAYVADLKAVRSAAQLVAHVRKWRLLWDLGRERLPKPKVDVGHLLVSMKFNTKGLLKKMKQLRKHHWSGRATARVTYLAGEILVPGPLLHAEMLAHKYGCPTNTAMIQLYDGQDLF